MPNKRPVTPDPVIPPIDGRQMTASEMGKKRWAGVSAADRRAYALRLTKSRIRANRRRKREAAKLKETQ